MSERECRRHFWSLSVSSSLASRHYIWVRIQLDKVYSILFLSLPLKKKCLLLREREGEREEQRGRERIPSRLHTVSAEPNLGLDLMNCEIMT